MSSAGSSAIKTNMMDSSTIAVVESTRSFDMGCTRDANAKLADRGDRARARFKARGERAGNLKLKLGQGWASGFLIAILRRIPVLFSRLLTASSEFEVPGFQLTHLTPSALSSKLFRLRSGSRGPEFAHPSPESLQGHKDSFSRPLCPPNGRCRRNFSGLLLWQLWDRLLPPACVRAVHGGAVRICKSSGGWHGFIASAHSPDSETAGLRFGDLSWS